MRIAVTRAGTGSRCACVGLPSTGPNPAVRHRTASHPPPVPQAPALSCLKLQSQEVKMNQVSFARAMLLALVVLLCATVAFAQSDLGSISGFVKDPSGAVVP